MATTPEEFFVKGLMEQSPPSPPVFLDDLPQKPNGSSEDWHPVPNDLMIPYLSRVLLEDDDIDDDELHDQPGLLLQVQQPFAQILSSSPSFGTDHDTSNTEQANNLFEYGGPDPDKSTLNATTTALSNKEVMQAFLKGMEDASMLLPNQNNFRGDNEQVNQIVWESSNLTGVKRYNRDNHVEEEIRSRTSKAAMLVRDPEENCANKMLDEMMLYAYETCIRGMDKLRLAMDNEASKKMRKIKKGSKARRDNVVDIRTLLISCAQAVSENDHMRARELLKQIRKHASATGDATQRLAHCFTKGLEARLVGSGSQIWKLLMAEKTSVVEYLKAYKLYTAACCFNKVAFIYSTLTIMQAMEGRCRLHIVDYGMNFGFQWAGLLRMLASREGGLPLPEVKITTIGHPQSKSCPAEQIEETEHRLRKCAHEFGLHSFKFHKIMKKWEDVGIEDLDTEADEVLVVNDLFNFSTLMDESAYFEDDPSPRDTVLSNIKKMRPDVFIQSILNCSCGFSFLSRFREALFYYMALFDILDSTMPSERKSRLVLEQVVLGRSALNVIACEGRDLMDHPEKYRQWQTRNQRAGLRKLPLNSGIVELVKDKVQKHHHKDFLICEDDQWLLQGWMGRVLFAHSTWVAEDASS